MFLQRGQTTSNTARRSCFGEALEDRVNPRPDDFVRMELDLVIDLAPPEAHRQPAPQLTARGLVANATVADTDLSNDYAGGVRQQRPGAIEIVLIIIDGRVVRGRRED
jgi:hypothetical protein